MPTVSDVSQPIVEVKALGFAASNREFRRVARQSGLRLVVESNGNQDQVILTADDACEPLATVVLAKLDGRIGRFYLKVGRRLARISTA